MFNCDITHLVFGCLDEPCEFSLPSKLYSYCSFLSIPSIRPYPFGNIISFNCIFVLKEYIMSWAENQSLGSISPQVIDNDLLRSAVSRKYFPV